MQLRKNKSKKKGAKKITRVKFPALTFKECSFRSAEKLPDVMCPRIDDRFGDKSLSPSPPRIATAAKSKPVTRRSFNDMVWELFLNLDYDFYPTDSDTEDESASSEHFDGIAIKFSNTSFPSSKDMDLFGEHLSYLFNSGRCSKTQIWNQLEANPVLLRFLKLYACTVKNPLSRSPALQLPRLIPIPEVNSTFCLIVEDESVYTKHYPECKHEPDSAGMVWRVDVAKARFYFGVETAACKRGELGLPGGKYDPREETLKAAAVREVKEETGLTLDQKRMIVVPHLCTTFYKGAMHYVSFTGYVMPRARVQSIEENPPTGDPRKSPLEDCRFMTLWDFHTSDKPNVFIDDMIHYAAKAFFEIDTSRVALAKM